MPPDYVFRSSSPLFAPSLFHRLSLLAAAEPSELSMGANLIAVQTFRIETWELDVVHFKDNI